MLTGERECKATARADDEAALVLARVFFSALENACFRAASGHRERRMSALFGVHMIDRRDRVDRHVFSPVLTQPCMVSKLVRIRTVT